MEEEYKPLTWEQAINCMWRWHVHAIQVDIMPWGNIVRLRFMEIKDQWQEWYFPM